MPQRRWPLPVAVLALVMLDAVVPVISVFGALQHVSLFGGTSMTPDQQREQFAWFVAGTVSAGIGLVAGIVAIAAARSVAPRVVGAFALVLAVVVGGVLALASLSAARALPREPAPQSDVPSCGPDSHPVVFGGGDRYTACPEDLATAQDFVREITPDLPTDEVTPDAVDRFAKQATASAAYGQAIDLGDGTLVAAWVPAPVTCAIFTWDGSSWQSEVTGLLADGGCIYLWE
jgi:hypothetical protein